MLLCKERITRFRENKIACRDYVHPSGWQVHNVSLVTDRKPSNLILSQHKPDVGQPHSVEGGIRFQNSSGDDIKGDKDVGVYSGAEVESPQGASNSATPQLDI